MRVLRWSWPMFVVAIVVLWPWGCYELRPERRVDVVVLDKTVPFSNRIEHRSLFWLLDHLKIRRPDGRRYDASRDYVGAFAGPRPGSRPERTLDLDAATATAADLVYVADTYGVYEGDLASGRAMKAALERSPLIYGGLHPAEVDALRRASAAGRTVVAEFNTLESPTGARARDATEELLGVRWTHWIGRYFSRLDDRDEVPQWMRRNYEREWNRPWEFEGPGYVVLYEDLHVEVLRPGVEVERLGLTLERARPVDPLLLGARDGVPYPYWWSWVEAQPGTEVLARFEWHPTEAGRERLRVRGLPESFPAVCRRAGAGGAPVYHFAGDFADNPMPDMAVPLAGYTRFKSWLEGARIAPSESAFYWRFYVPMMTRLLDDTPANARR